MQTSNSSPVTRLGIVGTGWGASVQVPAFRQAGWHVAAICGRNLERTRKASEELGIPHYFTDFNDLIRHPEVDVVSIVTPPSMHAEMAIAALQAGKHVLCDKPTCRSEREAKRMLEAVSKCPNQIAWMDHELRFLPLVQRARELVRDEATFGTPLYIDVRMLSSLAVHKHYNWWHDKDAGGGIAGAIGSHIVDLLTFITGQKVVRAHPDLRTLVQELPDEQGKMHRVTSDDFCSAQLWFNGGLSGVMLLSAHFPAAPERKVRIVGTKRVVTLDLTAAELLVTQGREQVLQLSETIPPQEASKLPPNVWTHGTVLLARGLREAVLARQTSPHTTASSERIAANFNDGYYVQKVLDALLTGGDEMQW